MFDLCDVSPGRGAETGNQGAGACVQGLGAGYAGAFYGFGGKCRPVLAVLLSCAKEELADKGLEFYVVSDGKSKDAQEMLAHMEMTAAYSEMMMAAPLSTLKTLRFVPGEGIRAAEEEFRAEEKGEEWFLMCRGQAQGSCRLAYFSGTAYLYGFTIEENMRRQGLGRLFLKLLASSQKEGIHTMLLQVGSRNAAACGLYRACGFQVTEQLDYYPA